MEKTIFSGRGGRRVDSVHRNTRFSVPPKSKGKLLGAPLFGIRLGKSERVKNKNVQRKSTVVYSCWNVGGLNASKYVQK